MKQKSKSFVGQTNQAWKDNPWMQSGFTVVAVLFIVVPLFIDSLAPKWIVLCDAVGGIIALSGLMLRFSIRCPVCRSYWYLRAANTLPMWNMSNWLHEQEKCPTCGASGKIKRNEGA